MFKYFETASLFRLIYIRSVHSLMCTVSEASFPFGEKKKRSLMKAKNAISLPYHASTCVLGNHSTPKAVDQYSMNFEINYMLFWKRENATIKKRKKIHTQIEKMVKEKDETLREKNGCIVYFIYYCLASHPIFITVYFFSPHNFRDAVTLHNCIVFHRKFTHFLN